MDNLAGIPDVPLGSLTGPTAPNTNLISVSFDNKSGQLNNITAAQLFDIQSKKGLQGVSYPAWKAFGGSIVLDFGKDIALKSGLIPGSKGSYQLQITASFQNNYNHQVKFNPVMVLWYDGFAEINSQRNYQETAQITQQQIKKLEVASSAGNGLGGGIFDTAYDIATALAPKYLTDLGVTGFIKSAIGLGVGGSLKNNNKQSQILEEEEEQEMEEEEEPEVIGTGGKGLSHQDLLQLKKNNGFALSSKKMNY